MKRLQLFQTRCEVRSEAAGFSLIELLVSMVIGLVLTLAITTVLTSSEGKKRSTTSVNDINQTGAYASFVLDRTIRSAGSGFSQRWSETYGCLLDVAQGGTKLLPRPTALAGTFVNYTMPVRLAPVIIGKGMANTGSEVRGDVISVMAGTGGLGETARPVLFGSVTSNNLRLENTLGYRSGDMVLLTDKALPAGCMMQQVTFPGTTAGSTDQNLPLSGTYYTVSGTNVSLADFGNTTYLMQLGNAAANPPVFQLFGVGANNTLFSWNLLDLAPSDLPVAEGVLEMRALYGVDTTSPPDGVLDSWIDPIAGTGYEAGVLTDGSSTSQSRLRRIISVRIGLILRTSLEERSTDYQLPTGSAVTLFSDLGTGLTRTRALSGRELNFRYRTVEVTIPLRNVLLAPASPP